MMNNKWREYNLRESPELFSPEETIREALRYTIGNGEGIDSAVLNKFKDEIKAESSNQYANAFEKNPSSLIWDKEDFVRDIREWTTSIWEGEL